jgi:endonuclease G
MVLGGVYPKTSEPVTIICHQRYVIGFSEKRHTPLWVAEKLTADEVSKEGHGNRQCTFKPDPAVPLNSQGSAKAYVGTNYDKGHMANYEDMNDDPVAAGDTCFFTNAVPQAAKNNRGIWRSLEINSRKVASANGTTFIVTGPIFDGAVTTLADGTPIPTRLFKVIVSPDKHEVITALMPNANGLDASTLPLYLVPLRNLQVANPLVDVLPTKPALTDVHGFK